MRSADNRLASQSQLPLYLHYLYPTIIATMLIACTYLVDTIVVGRTLGETGLAALNVVVPVTGLMYAAGFMFGFGSSNLFSNSLGEGNDRLAREYYGTSVLGLFIFSLAVMIPGLIFTGPIARLLCGGESFSEKTEIYLKYVFWFTPFYCFETYYSVYVRNDGAPVFSMIGTFTTTIANIALDYILVVVWRLGMMGASLATGIALVLGFAAAYSSTFRKASRLKLHQAKIRPDLMKTIMLNGTSDFFREISGSALVLAVNLVLLRIDGMTAVAAYGVIANLGNVVLCALAGVSNTVQPLASYNIGAGQYRRSVFFLNTGAVTTIILAGLYTAFAEIRPEILVTIFLDTPTPELTAISIRGIRIISVGYMFAGLTNLMAVYLEAEHEPKTAFVISVLRGFIMPLLLMAALTMIMGVDGVWTAFLAGETLSLATAVTLFRKVQKKHV